MRTIILLALSCLSATVIYSFSSKNEQKTRFAEYFESKTLRIDYELIGDNKSEEFVLKQLKKQNFWAGPQKLPNGHNLDLGIYRFSVYDSATNILIYQNGFSSLFNEYQTTDKAKKEKESYYHVNLVPYPKAPVRYVLEKRDRVTGLFGPVKEMYINPNNYLIVDEGPHPYKYTNIVGGGNINHKIDIAFIAEGYTKKEMGKFRSDVKRIWGYMVSIPPFDLHKDAFNIYAVESASVESGTDNPGRHIYKNTVLNSTFYTFDTDRYLTTKDTKAMHDIAETVPYDQIFVIINSPEYGGGGFYNYYSATTSDNAYSLKVAIHEFGHGFAGLADEYYTSDVAYDGFYNLNVEPWEPNITTLVNFSEKWGDMIPETTKIPTPRNYDLRDSVGVYQGGGYSANGIYSPFQDCRMKSNVPHGFCPVCSEAIIGVIEYYTK